MSRVALTLILLAGGLGDGAAATITVPAGGDLQAALTAARPGDTIRLEAGATFVGNFVLPPKAAGPPITIRSTALVGIPDDGVRITPAAAGRLPKLRSPNNMPALRTAPGTRGWRLELLEFQANSKGQGDIITLGDGSSEQRDLAQVPSDIVLDRCYIHGDAEEGQKRCVALNSARTTIQNSHISDCKAVGQDSQAIAGWNGPGPFTIANNYLEAAGENVLFGGADPAIPNLVPADIRITGNLIARPVEWRNQRWQVKNLLELKNARRVTIDRNTLQHNWLQAQTGPAILFTVRNQDGRCPWCQVEDVVFEYNTVRHVAAGLVILGRDDRHPSQQTRNITIRHNFFLRIDNERWGGNGYFLLINGAPRDIVIDHNTILQDRAYGIAMIEGPPVLGFVFTNNITRHNEYGIIGANHAPGHDTISAYLPGSRVTGNAIADGRSSAYPGGNRFPSTAELMREFVSPESDDFRLTPKSGLRSAGLDGMDLGATLPDDPPPTRRLPLPTVDRRP
jgi:hypothetical protein